MDQSVTVGREKQPYPGPPWPSRRFDREWSASLDQLGSYVLPYLSETISFRSGMQPCPVALVWWPLYPNPLVPSPLRALTHAHTEPDKEIAET